MSIQIERTLGNTDDISVTDAIATCGAVPLGPSAGGALYCVSASASPVTIQWWASYSPSSPYYRLHDNDNVAVNTPVQADRCYPLPDGLFGAWSVKAVANTAGQTATLRFSFKG